MASKERSSIERQKAQLIHSLDLTRRELSSGLDDMTDVFDVWGRVKRSISGHGWKWMAGSVVLGAMAGLSLLPGRSSNGKGKRSFVFPLMGFLVKGALTMAQPALLKMAQDQLLKRTNPGFPTDEG